VRLNPYDARGEGMPWKAYHRSLVATARQVDRGHPPR
jgi:hypothetical protein